jgi:hypothetical protein
MDAPTDAGAVTFVDGAGQLVEIAPNGSAAHCLADKATTDTTTSLEWAGAADRVLLSDGKILTSSGGVVAGLPAGSKLGWSRPKGTAIIGVTDDGHLLKRTLDGSASSEISFLANHDEAVYHPAGRAIASTGVGSGGYGIYLADNQGRLLRPLVLTEGAHISQLQWTVSGALMFVADHGDHTDLHRLDLGTGELTTATAVPGSASIDHFVASTFPGGGVAWVEGNCKEGDRKLVVERGGAAVTLPSTLSGAAPVGWLPDGVLVLQAAAGCATNPTGALYALEGSTPTRLVSAARGPAVRVVLPAGPELPASIPDSAPA